MSGVGTFDRSSDFDRIGLRKKYQNIGLKQLSGQDYLIANI
jgi:hypothetical protein